MLRLKIVLLKREKKIDFNFFSFRYHLELGKKWKIFRNNFSNLFLLFLEKTQKLFLKKKRKNK